MNCSEVLEHISSVVDNRLGGKELDEFYQHAKICRRCKDEYDLERVTKIFLQSSLHPFPPPLYLEHRLLTLIKTTTNSGNIFSSVFELLIKRWYFTVGLTTALILIFVWTQKPSSHSHTSPQDNNFIHFVYNNFDAVQKGETAQFTEDNNANGFGIGQLKDCSLIGTCNANYKGQQVTHSIYKKENCTIYCLQINFDSIKNNPNLTLPSQVLDKLKETGRYVADMHKCCSVILWVKDNNLFAAAAEMDINNLMAFLTDAEAQW